MIIKTDFKILRFLLIFILFKNIINDNKTQNAPKIHPLTKIDVFYSEFHSKINRIVHCSNELKDLIVLNLNGELLISNNFGKNYFDLRNKLEGRNDQIIYDLLQNPNDLKNIIFVGGNQTYWQTTNCGESIELILNGGKLSRLLFHPLDKDKIIVNYYNQCKNSNDKNCKIQYELMFTKDQGKNWNKIAENVEKFLWTKFFEDDIFSSRDRIIFIQTQLSSTKSEEYLFYTDDLFKTKNLIQKDVERFIMTDEFLFIKKNKTNKQHYKYYSSNIFGFFYHFRPIELDIVPEYGYDLQFLSSFFPGMTYITASYDSNSLLINNLYYSIDFGTKFELILENLVCNISNENCDVYMVDSIEGVLISNVYDKNYMVNLDSVAINKRSSNNYVTKIDNMINKVKTQISFDYGKTWTNIKKPYESSNNCFNCSLNLFLPISDTFEHTGINSSKSAPGIILALGQISEFLDENKKLGVYLSVDGGLNWKKILDGNYNFELINKGGFIIAYEKNKFTDSLKISENLGDSWEDMVLSSQADGKFKISGIDITNLKIDRKFVVYGFKKDKYNFVGVSVTVNLNNWHENDCELTNDIEKSDYEIFEPVGLTDRYTKCFNGREIQFFRKKKDRKCFNKLSFDLFKVVKHCRCTEEDWHCDFGFEKNEKGICELVTEKNKNELLFERELKGIYEFNNNFEKYLAPKNCFGYYYKTSGYRKNNKSFCYGGVDHSGKEVKCPNNGIDFFSFFYYSFLILIFIGLFYFISNNILLLRNYFENFNNNSNYFETIKKILNDSFNKIKVILNKLLKKNNQPEEYILINKSKPIDTKINMDDNENLNEEENDEENKVNNKDNEDEIKESNRLLNKDIYDDDNEENDIL